MSESEKNDRSTNRTNNSAQGAKEYTAQARDSMRDDMFVGFKGAETAITIGMVKNYILGISKECF